MDSLSATPVTSSCSSLLQSSIVFKLPYHLMQRCLHHSANCPGKSSSRWDCSLSIIVRLISVPPSRHIHPSIIIQLISVLPSCHIHLFIFVQLISVPPSCHIHLPIIVQLISVLPSRHIHPSIFIRLISVPSSHHIHPSIFTRLISVLPSRHIHPSIIIRLISVPPSCHIHQWIPHVDLRDDIYKHPNHKLRFPVPRYPMARGTQGCRQESSLTRRGYCPLSPPGQ